jgi:mono/diheme cytochrome c family protein
MMKYSLTAMASASMVALTLFHGAASAQTARVDLGKREFESNCASCHGANGKGGGYAVEWLRKSPTDLTTLSKRNAGVFPVSRMYEMIEGANVPSHGARDMPVWGMDYRIQAGEYYADVPYDPEAYVRGRILALIEYINRLQEK